MWELFPFPDEADLDTYNDHYLKGVCIAGVLVLVVLTMGILMFRLFGHGRSTDRGQLSQSLILSIDPRKPLVMQGDVLMAAPTGSKPNSEVP